MSTPIAVSTDRIRSLLSRRNLNFGDYQDDELAVPTSNAIYFWNTSNPQILQLRAQWRGVARDDAEFAALVEEIAQCNAMRTGPKAYLAPFEDGAHYGLVAECNVMAVAGLTETQLATFFESSMTMIMGFLHDLEHDHPEFVTWTRESDEQQEAAR